MKKIVEIENRIEKYMDLMLDLGIPLQKHIENYIQLRDLVKEYETTESNQQSQVVDAEKDDLIAALQDDVQDIQKESDRLDALKEQSKNIRDN
mgnify:CR=1 FL=1